MKYLSLPLLLLLAPSAGAQALRSPVHVEFVIMDHENLFPRWSPAVDTALATEELATLLNEEIRFLEFLPSTPGMEESAPHVLRIALARVVPASFDADPGRSSKRGQQLSSKRFDISLVSGGGFPVALDADGEVAPWGFDKSNTFAQNASSDALIDFVTKEFAAHLATRLGDLIDLFSRIDLLDGLGDGVAFWAYLPDLPTEHPLLQPLVATPLYADDLEAAPQTLGLRFTVSGDPDDIFAEASEVVLEQMKDIFTLVGGSREKAQKWLDGVGVPGAADYLGSDHWQRRLLGAPSAESLPALEQVLAAQPGVAPVRGGRQAVFNISALHVTGYQRQTHTGAPRTLADIVEGLSFFSSLTEVTP